MYISDVVKHRLEQAKDEVPQNIFTNNSSYYSQLNYQYQNYMQTVVKSCLAYSTGTVGDGGNSVLGLNTGKAIVSSAVKMVLGDKIFFKGDKLNVSFFNDIYAPSTNFRKLLSQAVTNVLSCGTTLLKMNIDNRGVCRGVSYRLDRTLFSVNEDEDITSATFFIASFGDMAKDSGNDKTFYWLVERRYYNEKSGLPTVVYKVFSRSGSGESPILPSPYGEGISFNNLPKQMRKELYKMGVRELNKEFPLPFFDGLGVWLIKRTAVNSVSPDLPFGDPLLYGCLNLLWAEDRAFQGLVNDVENGSGTVLIPQTMLHNIAKEIKLADPDEYEVMVDDLNRRPSVNIEYIKSSSMDAEQQKPTSVQFEIRAEKYSAIFDLYKKDIASSCGFAPSSVFPHLADNTVKTATETNAEENLTRATIHDIHEQIIPPFVRFLKEVLYQRQFPLCNGDYDISLHLNDYIGNKLQADDNLRQNVNAGIVSQRTAIRAQSNGTEEEVERELAQIQEEKKTENAFFNDVNTFNEVDYEKGGGINGNTNLDDRADGGKDTADSLE